MKVEWSFTCAIVSCYPAVSVDPLALYPTVVPRACQSQPDAAQQQTGRRPLEKRHPYTHGRPPSDMGK